MQVSHETIYKTLYVQGRGELRRELARCLRTGRAQRKPQGRTRRAGHILGSHTITHPNLAHVEQEEALRAEFVQSKRELEEHFEEQVTHFSYPHPALDPQWNEKTLAITRDAGYATAVTTTSGPVLADANPLLLKRIDARQADDEFLWNLERTLLQS